MKEHAKTAIVAAILLTLQFLPSHLNAEKAFTLNSPDIYPFISRENLKDAAAPEIPSPAEPAVKNEKNRFCVLLVKPGNDILPVFSDYGRVKAILELIRKIYYGESLPFHQDGQTFKNREGLLPKKPKGYYKEYTLIPPPHSPKVIKIGDKYYTTGPSYGTRGAERIIIGGGETVYYTPDHYRTFVEIRVVK